MSFKKGILTFLFTLCAFIAVLIHTTPKYTLSVGAIFRNEARFLKEWIEYHRLVGVEHFYLYNNLSNDDYLTVLKPYIEQGIVTLTQWSYDSNNQKDWNVIQCRAYTDLIKKTKRQTFWLAIIDTDEFIVPRQSKSLPDVLKPYASYGGIGINWQLFGTNNVAKIEENKTMIGSLTKRAPVDDPRNCFIKTIVRPHRVKKMRQPHYCHYKKPFYHVDENKALLPKKSLSTKVSVDTICLHHYTHRDEAFFYGEKVRRLLEWSLDKNQVFKPGYNDVDDFFLKEIAHELEQTLFYSTK